MEGILKRYNIEIIKQNNQIYVESNILATFLEMGNIRSSVIVYSSDEKCLLNKKDKRGCIQKTSCLTEKGFKKFICSSRKPKAVLIANELGLNVTHKYVVPET